jgi:hypothetical protein
VIRTCATLCLVAATASAEPLSSLGTERVAFSEVGLDGAMTAKVGAAFGVAPRFGMVVWFDATVAAGNLDPEDFRVRGGARIDLLANGPFHLRGTMLHVLRATKNSAFEAESFGTEFRLSPGFEVGRWALDAELDIENAELTRIAPTDSYRALVYPMATSHWYFDTATTIRLGLAGSVRVGDVELTARGGWADSGAKDFLPQVYVQAGAALRF